MIVGGIKKNNEKDFECLWPGRKPDFNMDGILGLGAYSGPDKGTVKAEAALLFRTYMGSDKEAKAEILSLQCADMRIADEAYQELLNSLINVLIQSDIWHVSFNIPNRDRSDMMRALVDNNFMLDETGKTRYEISRSQFLHTYLEREELTKDSTIEVYSLKQLTDSEMTTLIKNINRKANKAGERVGKMDTGAYDRQLSFMVGTVDEPDGVLLTEIDYEGNRSLTMLRNYGKNRKLPFVLLNELCSGAANLLKGAEKVEVTALDEMAKGVITQYFVEYSEYSDIEGSLEIDY